MSSKTGSLEAFHEKILAWASEPNSLRDIARYLQAEGVEVDFNAVGRYCKSRGIVLTPKTGTDANKRTPPAAPAQPPAPTPVTAPAVHLPPVPAAPPAPVFVEEATLFAGRAETPTAKLAEPAQPPRARAADPPTVAKPTEAPAVNRPPVTETPVPPIAAKEAATNRAPAPAPPALSPPELPKVFPAAPPKLTVPQRPKERPPDSAKPCPAESPKAATPKITTPPVVKPPQATPPAAATPVARPPVPTTPAPTSVPAPLPKPTDTPAVAPAGRGLASCQIVADLVPLAPADAATEPAAPSSPVPASPQPSPAHRSPPLRPRPPVQPWRSPPLPFHPLPTPPLWTPELPIIEFGGVDAWTLQDACEGTFIVGATGSGKTSGSGKTIAQAFLECGFGGLVLTVKPDERQLWERYAAATGRSDHLCVIEPGGPFPLNFLDYEARRPGAAVGAIENVTSLFQTIMEVYSRSQPNQAGQDFWVNAGKQLLRNTLRILGCSRPSLSLEEIRRFIVEAPASARIVQEGSWRSSKCFGPCFEEALRVAQGTPLQIMIDEAERYWMGDFPTLAEKTRSCIVTAFTAMADGFFDPAIYDLFCRETTLIPEAVLEGAILLVDLPLKTYSSVGLFAQSIWKYLFQKAVERRTDADDESRRPIFLWADEAQFFYSEYDGLFQSTARSSRCATVYLTQNLSGFYGLLGSPRAKEKVDGFLGNLTTKVIHNNNDHVTNEWAAQQIGRSLIHRMSATTNTPQPTFWNPLPPRQQSSSMQQVIDYEVQPSEFAKLRTGSNRYNGLVDAYWVKHGAQFNVNGKHYFKTVFEQELRS